MISCQADANLQVCCGLGTDVMEGSELLLTNDPNVARYDCDVLSVIWSSTDTHSKHNYLESRRHCQTEVKLAVTLGCRATSCITRAAADSIVQISLINELK